MNDFAYYGGAIDFKELTSNSQRKIGIAFGGGEIETNYTFPEHSYLNKYYDGKYLLKNEDPDIDCKKGVFILKYQLEEKKTAKKIEVTRKKTENKNVVFQIIA